MTAAAAGRPRARRRRRMFYVTAAVLTAAVVVLGFWPSFYGRGAALGPLKPLLVLHGAVFTVWLGLFLAQAALVPAGRTDLHRKLGWASAAWAVVMVVLGVMAGLDTLRTGSAPPGIDLRQFVMLPFGDIAIFAGLVGWAVAERRRPEWHKRLMTIATVGLLTPALARMPALQAGGPAAFLGATALAVAAVIAFDWIAHRRPHPATLWSGALVALGKPLLLFTVAVSPPWLGAMDALKG